MKQLRFSWSSLLKQKWGYQIWNFMQETNFNIFRNATCTLKPILNINYTPDKSGLDYSVILIFLLFCGIICGKPCNYQVVR